ncbi:MAG: FCD domain-containing protein [Acidobacteria bacterium]|nr:FCD domain-containing protein [Acidobacteriota bacterium]
MADRVKREVVRRILSGELEPGERLVELQLAKELQTSQGPVREALRELEALELVLKIPYKGSYVRDISDEEIREAYDIRALLEEHAGKLAACRLARNVDALREKACAIRQAAHAGDIESYARHDIEFHRMIVDASGNRTLRRTWDSLTLAVRVRVWLLQGAVDMAATELDHWPILNALEAGDGALAGRLLRRHIRRIVEMQKSASRLRRVEAVAAPADEPVALT